MQRGHQKSIATHDNHITELRAVSDPKQRFNRVRDPLRSTRFHRIIAMSSNITSGSMYAVADCTLFPLLFSCTRYNVCMLVGRG